MKKIFILIAICVIAYGGSKRATVNKDKTLDQNCVKCHIMYYPDFLPKRSWEALFSDDNLKNHFGESVVLTKEVKEKFLAYYLQYASDGNKRSRLGKKVNRSIPKSSTLLRIVKSPYHKDKHEDLKDEMVLKNKKVKSYSNCKACHDKGYNKGVFDEDDVDIPHWSKGFFGWKKD